MIAIISDLHFDSNNGRKDIFNNRMDFFNKQFFPFILDNNIKDVLCCGDIFNNRDKVDTYILQELQERFFGWFERNKIYIHTVLGNHDLSLKNSLSHSILKTLLRDSNYCKYYDEPTSTIVDKKLVAFIPWIIDEPVFPTGDIAVMHSELKGFSYTKGIECDKGFSSKELKQYKIVFNGHLHLMEQRDNICNVGNPYQSDWGDYNCKKGFWTLNDDLETTFIENIISPKHLKIVYSEKDGLIFDNEAIKLKDAIKIATENKIKLIVQDSEKKSALLKVIAEFQEVNPDVEIIENTEIVSDHDVIEANIKESTDTLEIINGYMDETVTTDDIDPVLTRKLLTELYKECKLAEV